MNKSSQNIAFLGLGVMGYAMAAHLAQANYNLVVYNRSAQKAQQFQSQYRCRVATSAAAAAATADVVICCLGQDEDVAAVLSGATGAIAAMQKDKIIIDHSTTSAQLAIAIERECRSKEISFLDAPISGGASGAQQGILSIMVGGCPKTLQQVRPILANYAKKITHIGATGDGQRCKMVNQLCIAGVLQGLSEGLNFAANANLDIDAVINAIADGAAASWQLQNRAHNMLGEQFDFGFAIRWMIKDLNYAIAEAQHVAATTPLAKQVLEQYQLLAQNGYSNADTCALIKALQMPSQKA